ncbi:MAG: glycine cleavage system protein GcvH, partial [Bacteroidota bacterium]
PENLRYTNDHEWIQLLDDNIAKIGITDFAQQELGDIVFIDINAAGKALKAEEVFGTVEAVKTVSDLYLPVAGTIIEVNESLNDRPESVNTDPYNEGWMIKLKVDNPADLDALMTATAYEALVG